MPKYRSNPTPWPNPAYYLLRLLQFISSIGIIGILSYFIYYLIKSRMKVPPVFIIQYVASLLALLNIITTTVAKCCGALNAKFAVAFDFAILAALAVAFGLLTSAMHGLPFSDCTNGSWGVVGQGGVRICRLYKGVWALGIVGLVTYFFSILVDGIVIRRTGNHKYVVANPKSMQQTKTYVAPNYSQDTSYGSGGLPSHG
ncbi:hypothetical protein TWF696_006681 [Orbilia brochopaga]|uniref:MARVEL domain-containing protein n=1 Tax=Orbilia brochopaga TaxID=3140254 RepID=A0AAV9UPJ5_9PEZI